MDSLMEIKDKDVGLEPKEVLYWKHREAARAIVFDFDKNKIALMHLEKIKQHKLPGGGVEEGESIIAALEREVLEEVGCKIKIKEKIFTIVEYRTQHELKQRSHIFVTEVLEKGKAQPTQEEIKSGTVVEWVSINDAIKSMKKELNETKNYAEKFMLKRDCTVLENFKMINKN